MFRVIHSSFVSKDGLVEYTTSTTQSLQYTFFYSLYGILNFLFNLLFERSGVKHGKRYTLSFSVARVCTVVTYSFRSS